MKNALIVLLCSLCLVVFASSAFAGSWRDGKVTYKNNCMSCHKRGGQAERLVLNQWSKAKWTKFFGEEKTGAHEEPWGKLSEEDRDNLLKYFHKYAKDDKTHLGCG